MWNKFIGFLLAAVLMGPPAFSQTCGIPKLHVCDGYCRERIAVTGTGDTIVFPVYGELRSDKYLPSVPGKIWQGPYFPAETLSVQPIPILPKPEFHNGRFLARSGLMFLSGAAYGVAETLKWHPDRFFAVHPGADRSFWDTRVSWKNKWKDGDPNLGEKFPGSSTAFVWMTDGYHLSSTISRSTGLAGLTIPIYGNGEKVGHRLLGAAFAAGFWIAGFHAAYTVFY